jgi:cell wall-associated NlpC family hydrolase
LKSNPQYKEPGSSTNTKADPERRFFKSREHQTLDEANLSKEIESYLGVPYRWGGTTREGMDCSGFVGTIYRDALDLKLPRSAKMMYRQGKYVQKEKLEFGDLVFFKNIESSGVSHVGIYVGNNEFAHASTTKGVTISNLNETYYRQRYVGARRVYRK